MDEGHRLWRMVLDKSGYFSDKGLDSSRTFDRSQYPGAYKRYTDALKRIPLADQDFSLQSAPIGKVLQNRRSLRNFTEDPLSFEDLSFLLWASQGLTASMEGYDLRTAPSAGALYPIETYIIVNNIESLDQGIYHYDAKSAELELLRLGNYTDELYKASLTQELIKLAAATFCFTAYIRRCSIKYYERSVRYIMMDSAHICENTLLGCVALENVGGVAIGAFFDDLMARLLDVEMETEPVLLLASVGKVSGAGWKDDRRTYIERLRSKAG